MTSALLRDRAPGPSGPVRPQGSGCAAVQPGPTPMVEAVLLLAARHDELTPDEPTPVREDCDHDGTERMQRTAHGYLGDAPAGTVETLCAACGAEVPAAAPGALPSVRFAGVPLQTDVDQLRELLDLMENFSDNDQRARYLIGSNWLRDRDAAPEEAGRSDG